MTYDFQKSRASWGKVAKAANNLNVARSVAKRSLIAMDTASPQHAFDTAFAAASPLRDIDWDDGDGKGPGHTFGTLALMGVEREDIPAILAACGLSEEEIAEAIKTPEAAYMALRKGAEAYRTPAPYNGGL